MPADHFLTPIGRPNVFHFRISDRCLGIAAEEQYRRLATRLAGALCLLSLDTSSNARLCEKLSNATALSKSHSSVANLTDWST